MATQAYPYLVITDGTLTAILADGLGGATSFAPLRGTWGPAIAARRRAALGRGPWDDVTEEWEMIVKGTDAATAMSNLETLTRLLDNADRFWRLGENVSPVLLKYAPQGSTIFSTSNPATCLILGRSPGDNTSLNLPLVFNDVGMLFEIRPVYLRFLRTGEWLNPTSEQAVTSAAANPTVQTANFASTLALASPLKLSVSFNFGGGGAADANASAPAVVLTATNTTRLQIYEAESGSLGTNVTSTADAAGKARGGSVARYAPGVLSTSITIDIAAGSFDGNCRRLAIWAPVRNNSATTTWSLRANAQHNSTNNAAGPTVAVDTSSTSPRLMFLGILSSRLSIQKIQFVLTASAASGSLDIDYFVVQAIDDECSGAVAIYGPTILPLGGDPTIIDPRPLEFPTPLLTETANLTILTYAGDAFLMSKGQSFAAVWLGTFGTFWRSVNAGNNIVDCTWTANRYNGYLSPR